MKDSKFNSEQVPFEPKYDDIKKKVNVNKYTKNRTIGSQRKGIMWFIMLIVSTPLLLIISMGWLVLLSVPEPNGEAISNFFEGMQYTSKRKHYEYLQDFSINNTYYNGDKSDDRVSTVIINKYFKMNREVNQEEKSAILEYSILNPNSVIDFCHSNIFTFEYKDNILTKTVGNDIYPIDSIANTQMSTSEEYDFESFVINSLIQVKVDFSRAKITKTKIEDRYISVEGVLNSSISVENYCCMKIFDSIARYEKPTFYYEVGFSSLYDFKPNSLYITFVSNNEKGAIQEISILIKRKQSI